MPSRYGFGLLLAADVCMPAIRAIMSHQARPLIRRLSWSYRRLQPSKAAVGRLIEWLIYIAGIVNALRIR